MTLANLEKILLFLVILFLPTQLGKHFWPDFAYIYSLKIDYLSPTIYFWDLLVMGLLAVWFSRKPKVNKIALNLLLFFLFTQILPLMEAQNIGAGLVRLEQYTLAGFFGVYLASQDFKKVSAKIFLPLTLGLLGEGVLAILQFFKGGTLGLWILGERTFSLSTPGIAKFDFYGSEFLRPYGTFPHPNVLAGFLLIGSWIMYHVSGQKQRMGKLVNVFIGVAIFLSMSRAAIFAAIVALLSTARRKLVWLGVAFLIVSPILFIRFSSLLNFDNLTMLRREELIENSWQIFVAHPLFGVGLNNFIPTLAGNLITGPSRFLQPVHNIFLLTLSETGLIGLIGLIALIAYPLRKLFTYHFSLVTTLPWLILIFLGMFDHYFLTLPQGYRLLFLVWGLSFSMLK